MCLLSYADGFRILFEWIGRTLVTTVVFCDFIVAMVLRDWEATQKKNDVLRPEHYVDFEAFHKELRSQWGSDEDDNKRDIEAKGAEETNNTEINEELKQETK